MTIVAQLQRSGSGEHAHLFTSPAGSAEAAESSLVLCSAGCLVDLASKQAMAQPRFRSAYFLIRHMSLLWPPPPCLSDLDVQEISASNLALSCIASIASALPVAVCLNRSWDLANSTELLCA